MLRRYSGIKPSHLWGRTSLKDFHHYIKERISAIAWEERNRKSALQLFAIGLGSGLSLLYTMGILCPERIIDVIKPYECKTKEEEKPVEEKPKTPAPVAKAKKKCVRKKGIDPCQPEPEPEMKPCPKKEP
ncbi:unnamed protein product [Danaus chrysippus]|uniref:(African queen) hypothetical protein n=1 Tax=Danaus chrysippus TaxID=151541 RepID=A0A8J2QR84_9NEOP|nr:unnamed protein product [Danaus chrysippus]